MLCFNNSNPVRHDDVDPPLVGVEAAAMVSLLLMAEKVGGLADVVEAQNPSDPIFRLIAGLCARKVGDQKQETAAGRDFPGEAVGCCFGSLAETICNGERMKTGIEPTTWEERFLEPDVVDLGRASLGRVCGGHLCVVVACSVVGIELGTS